ncbi:tetratricopeptide repeat protein [Algoriphagus halophilus]|uniref:Tetratricopeptide repeat-containing protein n=1 Tax=Algoriphagus halophilus TaxID=226505 RepID=A0A1N6D7V5_9BACT|nr:tetratricopeptide repeat protein [Algoriphagus halophilus]SIN66787.1 Tetratricopeptide repeat-containing protein [Algoriphagus halophilus]
MASSLGYSQEKLSKKERKAQETEAKTTRYYIEGEKYLVLGELDKAYFYLQKSLEFSPEEPAIHYKIAEVLLRGNKPEKALPYAETAANLDIENKYYALMVAEIYTNLKQPLKAAEILDRLTADGEHNQQYNLDLASIYLSAGEFDKALVVLDRAEEYYGVMEPVTTQKQRIYLRKNNLEKAIEEGERLIEAKSGNPDYVLNLVEILYNNNRSDQALDLVKGELAKFPNQPELHMAAYTLQKEKGQLEASEKSIITAFSNPDLDPQVESKAYESLINEMQTSERDSLLNTLEVLMLQNHPNDASVFAAIGKRRMKEGKKEEGIGHFKASLQIDPKNAELLEQVITNSFGENADFAEVEKFTIMGVDEFPERPEFWFYDGVIKNAMKKDSSAIISLEKSMEINAGKNIGLDQASYGALGNAYYNLGEKDKAFENFDMAIKLNPNDEQVLNNYAYFLSLEKRDLDKAKSMSEKVVKRFPNNGTFLDTHAWVLFQSGDYEGAKKYMDLALEHEAEPSGVMLEHYGDILYHLGKKSEAISYWKKAENSPEASDKLPQKIKEGKYHE